MSEQTRDGWFVRAAEQVGDLGSPFYEQEHQRDVWNEASAIGFQLLLWSLSVAAVVSVWVGGSAAVPYGLAMLLIPGLASFVVLFYARARGVDAAGAQGIRALSWRTGVWIAVAVAFAIGVIRAQGSDGFAGGAAWGAVAGAVLVVVALTVAEFRGRRAGA